MSLLYITEFGSTGQPQTTGPTRDAQAACQPALVDQTPVDFSGGHAESATLNAKTRLVRLIADADCSIAFGTAPTATTSNTWLPANAIEWYCVIPGLKISVIAN